MDDFLDIPEKAVLAFENITGLTVTVHDKLRVLWPFLAPNRFYHRHAFCQAVKTATKESCYAFEVDDLPEILEAQPEGRVHVCPAGGVECTVPVFWRRRLIAVLFAGIRRPGRALQCAVREPLSPRAVAAAPVLTLAAVAEHEAQLHLELLRQLGARIREWYVEYERRGGDPFGFAAGPAPEPDRRVVILRYVRTQHTKPDVSLGSLAGVLGLSPDRTAHVVKELCKQTFLQLLTECRVRTAASWLRHSSGSVLDIALRSGFGDVSHFHRVFKRQMGVTPHGYRRKAREERRQSAQLGGLPGEG